MKTLFEYTLHNNYYISTILNVPCMSASFLVDSNKNLPWPGVPGLLSGPGLAAGGYFCRLRLKALSASSCLAACSSAIFLALSSYCTFSCLGRSRHWKKVRVLLHGNVFLSYETFRCCNKIRFRHLKKLLWNMF